MIFFWSIPYVFVYTVGQVNEVLELNGSASFQDDTSLMSSNIGASKPVDAREMKSYAKVGQHYLSCREIEYSIFRVVWIYLSLALLSSNDISSRPSCALLLPIVRPDQLTQIYMLNCREVCFSFL